MARKVAEGSIWTQELDLDYAVDELVSKALGQHLVDLEYAYEALGLRREFNVDQTAIAYDTLWEVGLGIWILDDALDELTAAADLDAELNR